MRDFLATATTLLILACLSARAPALQDGLHESVLLMGFESEHEVAGILVRRSTRMELLEGDVRGGSRAAKVTYDAVVPGGEQWPAIILERGSLKVKDFTRFAALGFWAKNLGSRDAELLVTIWDSAGKRSHPTPHRFVLEPGKWHHAICKLSLDGINGANIGSVHFYQNANREPVELLLDDVRLLSNFAAKVEKTRQGLARASEIVAALELEYELGSSVARLASQLDELISRSTATAKSDARASEFERDLAGIDADAGRLTLHGAKLRAARTAHAEQQDYLLVPESSMVKVMPDDRPFDAVPGRPLHIAAARGEVEGGQVIVCPLGQALTGVTFDISELSGPDGAVLPRDRIQLATVGYVRTDPQIVPSYWVDRSGWFPDPLLPFVRTFDVDRDKVQSIWLNVSVPRDQAAGTYRGEITVTPANAAARRLAVDVRVFDFELPKQRSLRTAITTFEEQIAKMYPGPWEGSDMYWKYADFLHAHRINLDNIYRGHAKPPTVEQVKRLVAGGQDAWCLRGVSSRAAEPDMDPAKLKEYVARLIADARATYEVFKQVGAEEMCYIYCFDETALGEKHYAILREIRAALPDVKILTTGWHSRSAKSPTTEIINAWCPLLPQFHRDRRAEPRQPAARQDRGELWWYICIASPNPYPNWFVEYAAIEPRLLMGVMTQKYRPDGFLYYATTLWHENNRPIDTGPYTTWNPRSFRNNYGDGSLFCAGPDGPITTIRFENFRDGLEDFEYATLLERLADRADQAGMSRLADEARDALIVPEELVSSLATYSRSPDVLLAYRLKLAVLIEKCVGAGL